jgi:hypothetical protein
VQRPPAAPALPHRATPAIVYTTRPKATPSGDGHDRDHDTHERVRNDIIDKSGKVTWRYHGQMYSIGIGRTHGTWVRPSEMSWDITLVAGGVLNLRPLQSHRAIPSATERCGKQPNRLC